MIETIPNGNGFKFVRTIPIGVWVVLLGQIVAFGYWLIQIDTRGLQNAQEIAGVQARIEGMDASDTRAGKILSERVTNLERGVSRIVAYVLKIPNPPEPPNLPEIPKLPPQ